MLDSPGRSNLSFLWSLMTFGTENMTVHTVERNIILRNNIFSLQFWYQRRHQIFIAGKKASSPPTSTRWCIVRTYHIVPLVRHSLVVMFGKLPIFPNNMIWYFWISQQAHTICFFVFLADWSLHETISEVLHNGFYISSKFDRILRLPTTTTSCQFSQHASYLNTHIICSCVFDTDFSLPASALANHHQHQQQG